MRLQFPRFSRLFTATLVVHLERFIYVSMILAIFSLNIYVQINLQHPLASEIDVLLRAPYSAKAHEKLAQIFWEQGFIDEGKKELLLAQSVASQSDSSVLGITSRRKLWEEESQRLQREFAFWKKVAKEKPTYRDAFIQLTLLSYQLGYDKDAKEYLSRVQSLDPNNKYRSELEKLLEDVTR
ncbi:hypothetical protein HY409_00390 [Candidatus Gottesmanbacteria bacterium]|nr:hypothetical protein [Candidatus Gottesmanbacteria bacterium]